MDAAAVAQGRGRARGAGGRGRRRKVIMRLHVLSGGFEFVPTAAVAAAAAARARVPMDASVWSRLPDDMMWQVLAFLPAAKRCQFRSVSHKWRQVLTSPGFRPVRRRLKGKQQQRAVACAVPPDIASGSSSLVGNVDSASGASSGSGSSGSSKVMAVDVGLGAFVPRWFWRPRTELHKKGCRKAAYNSYSVVAAGDGLLCISNDVLCSCDPYRRHMPQPAAGAAATARYCVVNPVTRTCVVLPPGPFGPSPAPRLLSQPWSMHLSAAALTVSRWANPEEEERHDGRHWAMTPATRWEVATCGLGLAGAGGGGGPCAWTVAHKPVSYVWCSTSLPLLAQCGGETFWYHARRLHVLLPAPPARVSSDSEAGPGAKRPRLDGTGGGSSSRHKMLVEAADSPVDGPSVALLGLDPAATGYHTGVQQRAFLVAHRGAVLFVSDSGIPPRRFPLVAGVWWLDRRRMAWEPVSVLGAQEAQGLIPDEQARGADLVLCGAFVMHDLLPLPAPLHY